METEGSLSAAQVLNSTQPINEFSRPTMNATNEESAMNDFRLLIGGVTASPFHTILLLTHYESFLQVNSWRTCRSQKSPFSCVRRSARLVR
jgi:hypothetical protein